MTQDTTALAIVTGASSGVGLYATQALVDRGWHSVQLFCLFAGAFLLAWLALAGMTSRPLRTLALREAA